MNVGLIVLGIAAFAVIQIGILRSLPKSVLAVISMVPIVGTLANFVVSASIAVFTGAGTYVGLMNMIASVMVYFWLVGYRRYRQPEIVVKKTWTGIPVPQLRIRNQTAHWLF